MYAESFAARGIATLVFDYRTFGGSDGMPRNLVDPFRCVRDCVEKGRAVCITVGVCDAVGSDAVSCGSE